MAARAQGRERRPIAKKFYRTGQMIAHEAYGGRTPAIEMTTVVYSARGAMTQFSAKDKPDNFVALVAEFELKSCEVGLCAGDTRRGPGWPRADAVETVTSREPRPAGGRFNGSGHVQPAWGDFAVHEVVQLPMT
ncbi:hypothetical protein EVAR_22902_1 [Eumeta japonica]|uniref:Uncharacterized protein n=1 Tax=Eumeta variegata TaxID=151549 RepID=A0A4C1UVI6_EUMVA|nr:hypothetical protein EVAR_22902_1 [Eumeta japonica]